MGGMEIVGFIRITLTLIMGAMDSSAKIRADQIRAD